MRDELKDMLTGAGVNTEDRDGMKGLMQMLMQTTPQGQSFRRDKLNEVTTAAFKTEEVGKAFGAMMLLDSPTAISAGGSTQDKMEVAQVLIAGEHTKEILAAVTEAINATVKRLDDEHGFQVENHETKVKGGKVVRHSMTNNHEHE